MSYEHRLLWAACCLGFFGFLRSGEFTAHSQRYPGVTLISADDIARDSAYPPCFVRARLRRSKTDPFGRGIDIFLGRTSHAICPVAAILSFLSVRPTTLLGPLFCFQDGSVLTRDRLVREVRAILRTQGVDASKFSGHSFRIGAATAGIPDHMIKMLGRWESSAYLFYVRTPPAQLARVSATLVGRPGGVQPTMRPPRIVIAHGSQCGSAQL